MNRVVAFALSVMFFVGSLFPRVSTEQAARLPELMAHYHQHQLEEGCDLGFWSFLVEHYVLDSHHHKAPNHSHSRLPTLDNNSPAYDFTQLFRLVCELSVTELDSSAVFKTRLMISQQTFTSLLQPPRF